MKNSLTPCQSIQFSAEFARKIALLKLNKNAFLFQAGNNVWIGIGIGIGSITVCYSCCFSPHSGNEKTKKRKNTEKASKQFELFQQQMMFNSLIS